MKVALCLLIAITAWNIEAKVLTEAPKTHDLSIGDVDDKSWILWSRVVEKSGSWLPWKTVDTSFTYNVPKDSDVPTITAVRAFDQSPAGKGGFAKLASGGVGQDHVTIDFTSQKWQGIKYLVVVYGHF